MADPSVSAEAPLTVGSLFAGIGGFDLAAERVGWQVKWQVEIDPYCTRVLEKHWPHVRRYRDIRDVTDAERVDLVCGGFPCQPFSSASRGRRQGRGDDRYLWPDMLRIIAELRPAWVVAENVTHIDSIALDEVVSNLEANNYQVAPPLEVPACAFGFDHRRSRIWILGHADGDGQPRVSINAKVARVPRVDDDSDGVGAAYGVSRGMDRRRMAALGNAIVPQVAEWIFRQIQAAEVT